MKHFTAMEVKCRVGFFRLTNGNVQKNFTFDYVRVVGADATGTSRLSASLSTVVASR